MLLLFRNYYNHLNDFILRTFIITNIKSQKNETDSLKLIDIRYWEENNLIRDKWEKRNIMGIIGRKRQLYNVPHTSRTDRYELSCQTWFMHSFRIITGKCVWYSRISISFVLIPTRSGHGRVFTSKHHEVKSPIWIVHSSHIIQRTR